MSAGAASQCRTRSARRRPSAAADSAARSGATSAQGRGQLRTAGLDVRQLIQGQVGEFDDGIRRDWPDRRQDSRPARSTGSPPRPGRRRRRAAAARRTPGRGSGRCRTAAGIARLGRRPTPRGPGPARSAAGDGRPGRNLGGSPAASSSAGSTRCRSLPMVAALKSGRQPGGRSSRGMSSRERGWCRARQGQIRSPSSASRSIESCRVYGRHCPGANRSKRSRWIPRRNVMMWPTDESAPRGGKEGGGVPMICVRWHAQWRVGQHRLTGAGWVDPGQRVHRNRIGRSRRGSATGRMPAPAPCAPAVRAGRAGHHQPGQQQFPGDRRDRPAAAGRGRPPSGAVHHRR